MTEYTEQQILSLTGRELWAAVEWLCFGDDLSAGDDADRLSDALGHSLMHGHSAYQHYGATIVYRWIPDGETEFHVARWSNREMTYFSRKDATEWVWSQRHGKPWQSDLEQHVANWRAEPRNFGSLDVCVPELMGRGWCLWSAGDDWYCHVADDLVADSKDPATAICRAACIVALREGE